ncbi:MAG TPA: ABC transporter ATP-binding protein [Thermoguttaceae bacterium]|nr:ABC transporter ATP-binding protein [Thermoguttaceae bacterium]
MSKHATTKRSEENRSPGSSATSLGTIHRTTPAKDTGPVVLSATPHRVDPPHARPDILRATGLFKSFRKGPVEVPVLRGVDLTVRQGELLAVVGQSGSGKSTLLHLLATLDVPDQGEIHFEGLRIDRLPGRRRDLLRNRRFGMIFQFYHLLPELNVLENVLAPLMIAQSVWSYVLHRRQHRRRAAEFLELVGLSHRLKHKPRELSGGEMQRTAIARALVTQPDLLLADEPTGNLDAETGREIIEVLRRLNRERNLTIVMVTHDPEIARQADRVIRLVDGRVETA